MIAKFSKTDRGLALAVALLASLTLITLTDAQTGPSGSATPAYSIVPDASKGVWVVRFEPAGDFSPRSPEEFLSRFRMVCGQGGLIGKFRCKWQGDKFVGSLLAYDAEQLKQAVAAVPGLQVTSVEKLTQETLTEYENLPQESVMRRDAGAGLADTHLGSKVKYTSDQASVQDIVQSLAEQVGLKYDWQKSFAQTNPLCRQWVRNVAIEGKTCSEALEQILKPVGLRYEVEGGALVLSRQDEGTQEFQNFRDLQGHGK